MNDIKIEKGIQKPRQGWSRQLIKYPFQEMEVGDSFFLAGVDKTSGGPSGSAVYWGNKLGRKFVSRKVEGGIRIWRTE